MTERIGKAKKKEDEELVELLNKITASPCVLVVFRSGPTAYFGPFDNFDQAGEYRTNVLGGHGVIHGIAPPTNPPDWSLTGQLQG